MFIQTTWHRAVSAVAAATLILGLGSHARAQTGPAESVSLTLEQLLDTVRAVNPSLKSAQLEWVAKYRRADEPSLPDPSVMFTWLPEPIYTARGAQTWQVRAEQRIPFPGKLRLRSEVAVEEAYITQQSAARYELQLAFEVKRAYHKLRRIAAQEALTIDFAGRIEEFEDAASSRYKLGTGSQQAIVKAQLEGNNLDNILLGLDKERIQVEAVIAHLRGDGIVTRIEPLPAETWDIPGSIDIGVLVAAALEHRPDIRAIDASIRRSEHAEELARKQLWPDIGLGVTYFGIDRTDIPASADGKDALALTASIQIPLFRAGRNAVIESEQIARSSTEMKRVGAEARLRAEITDLLWRIQRERARLDLIRQTLIPQAESTFDLALNLYTNGRLQFIDLLDAERALFMIHNDLEKAVENYNVMLAELELTLGVQSISEVEQLGLLGQIGMNHE